MNFGSEGLFGATSGVAPKFAFDSKLQSLHLNYERLLEPQERSEQK
jgi:hypothetical protein